MINVIVAEEMFGNELAWACLRGAGVLFAALAPRSLCCGRDLRRRERLADRASRRVGRIRQDRHERAGLPDCPIAGHNLQMLSRMCDLKKGAR